MTCKLGTTEIGVSNVILNHQLNQISRVAVVVANTNQNRAIVTDNINNTLHIYRDEIEIFTGRIDVDMIEYTQTTINISGYASYIDLHFEFFSRDQGQYDIRRVQFDNIAANTILGYVLAGTGYTTSECPTTLISLRGEYETRLQWISAIAKACKWTDGSDRKSCDWWIDTSDQIHIAQERGSAKGELTAISLLKNQRDYSSIQNRVYGLGYGDGINQLNTVKYNSGSETAYDTREVCKIDRRFTNQTSFDDEMQEHADNHAVPVHQMPGKISTFQWYDLGLEVGDTVTIELLDLDVTSASYRIMNAKIRPVETTLDIVNVVPLLSSEIQQAQRQLYIDGGYMQGATNIWQISHGKNVSNAVPITLKIFIPDDAVYINAAKLSYAVLDFEKYTGVTSGGSSHSHDISVYDPFDTSDIGNLGIQSYGGQNYLVANKNLSAIQGNAADTTHTHDVDPNLSTSTADCNDIAVSVDSVDKTAALEAIYGTLSTSEDSDLEIKDYLSSPAAGSWHTVTITPNGVGSPAGMCYVMVYLSIQVFIRSE